MTIVNPQAPSTNNPADVPVVNATSPQGVSPGPAQKALSVLIIGQERVFERILAAWLEEAGWRVHVAQSYRAALTLRHDPPVDVIVGDLDGEDLDGLEFATRLADRPSAPPVVLTTHAPSVAHWRPADLRQVGVSRIILRPCHLSDAGATLSAVAQEGS
ncbi:MAG: response regulator [Myxococcales bacterium]|nr:response regulator [Myxococcales bacterium]